MALHPDAATLLDRLAAAGAPPLSAGTPAQARATYDAAPKPMGDPMEDVRDVELPGPGGPLPVRIYRPAGGPAPGAIAFFHGGGWVLSSVDGHDNLARRLAARSGAVVVSVEYRLAPEHPFPAPHEDCWAATRWLADVVEHAPASIGVAVDGRLGVAGDSAGGNLAAGVALRARDEGLPLAFQLLIYPCLDDRLTSPSATENGEGYFLGRADMVWFWDHFAPPGSRSDPYAVPARAEDLSGLAPALIQTAEFDPLRDEGEAWGERLRAAGVPVTVTRYDGMIHGFVSRWDALPSAVAAHDEFGPALAQALAGTPTGGP